MDLGKTSSAKITKRPGLTAGETIAYLFQPDTFLMEKFFNDRRGTTRLEPEKRLMLAILEDAFYCFEDNYSAQHGKRKQLFDNVQRWFFSVSNDWVFSFENICSVLDFNPEYLRKGLARWKEKELSKHRISRLSRAMKQTPGPQLIVSAQ
jgi:hypothetical protein